MSLVPKFVKADGGFYYKNPVIERDDWFICFDPPEFVVKTMSSVRLSDVGINFKSQRRLQHCGMHIFKDGNFTEARNQFFQLKGPIPVPDKHEGRFPQPVGECVVYSGE